MNKISTIIINKGPDSIEGTLGTNLSKVLTSDEDAKPKESTDKLKDKILFIIDKSDDN